MPKTDSTLFTMHEKALENEYGCCPECGNKLLIRHSKNGAFLGCSAYPSCQYVRAMSTTKDGIEDQVIADRYCPDCQGKLVVRSGQYGMFICCINYPECSYRDKNEQQSKGSAVSCPQCKTGVLQQRTNRYGKMFFACDQYPKCKYLVNFQPVEETCPSCGFPILIERNTARGNRLECPQKNCKYKRYIELNPQEETDNNAETKCE